jgi:hypothetical protein
MPKTLHVWVVMMVGGSRVIRMAIIATTTSSLARWYVLRRMKQISGKDKDW